MNPDLAKLAQKYFKLQLPCTSDDLKRAWKREAKLCHPDIHPGDVATETHFKKLNEAYTILCDKPEIIQAPDVDTNPRTIDGILLSELGLGWEEGGTPCPTCDSKGFTTIQADPFIQCRYCRGSGAVVTCPACKGTGKGFRPLGGKCRKCDGLGKLGVSVAAGLFMSRAYGLCIPCGGRGGFRATKPVFKHFKCGDCEGKGQRKMFNPLWPKFRMGRR